MRSLLFYSKMMLDFLHMILFFDNLEPELRTSFSGSFVRALEFYPKSCSVLRVLILQLSQLKLEHSSRVFSCLVDIPTT